MGSTQSSKENQAHKTRQGFIWYTTVPFTFHFLRFANSIILARLLSPRDFGIIGIITVILYYCDSFSDFGFGKALIQKERITEDHYMSYLSFNMLISVTFFLGAQIFSDPISDFYDIPELDKAINVFAFIFLLTALSAGPKVKLSRDINFKALAIIEGIKVSISIATSLTLALHGFEFWSIIYAMLLAQIASLIALLYVSNRFPRFGLNFRYLRELSHFGVWDFVGAQVRLISDSADKLIIGKILGASSLGYYDKAFGLARMPNDQIANRISHVSFASFSRMQSNREELENHFLKLMTVSATILLPIFVGLIWVAKSFTLVLLGEKWLPLVPCFQIFAFSFIFAGFAGPINSVNLAVGKVRPQTLIRIILTVFLVPGLIIVSPYGIEVAALTILSFNMLMFVFSYQLLSGAQKIGWTKLVSSLMPPLILVTCMVSALVAFSFFFGVTDDLTYLALSVLIGGATYSIFFVALPFKKLAFLRNRVLAKLSIRI